MKKLLLVALLGAAVWWYFVGGRKLDEAQVNDFYRRVEVASLDRKPDEYADGIAKQMLGTDAPEFFEWCHLRDLTKISQALAVEQNRKGAATK